MAEEKNFAELIEVMARLRAEDGCPWDREQTHQSLKPYLLEETYEALEAIDAGDFPELCKELGDVLLQIVFHAQIASEAGHFTSGDVCRAIVDKLVHRHPHVFGDVEVDGPDQVLTNWEQLKRQEKGDSQEPHSSLDGVPKHLPALLRAQRVQSRASRVGFDWDRIDGPLDKVEEEFAELRREWEEGNKEKVEEEFGDLLFALVNTARFLKVDSEDSLRRAVSKFERRFRAVEATFRQRGEELSDASLEEMDRVWDQVKEGE
jgi:tetrapyrrole methylase family protein / MazG family protein